MRIPNEAVEAAYAGAKGVHDRTRTKSATIDELVQRYSLNRNSATDMITNVVYMLKGERYERTNNAFATEHFLKMIRRDFGLDALKKAISAVNQHLDYYENLRKGSKLPAIRKILEKFREIARNGTEIASREGLTDGQRHLFARQVLLLQQSGEFDPNDMADARERVTAAIVRRQGQPAFRIQLLSLYQGQCAISGCEVQAVLEAAHILSYKGPKTNHPSNGLLLRADLHTLFDLRLIAIDPETMTILIASVLQGTCYQEYAGKRLRLPPTRLLSQAVKHSGSSERKAAQAYVALEIDKKGPYSSLQVESPCHGPGNPVH